MNPYPAHNSRSAAKRREDSHPPRNSRSTTVQRHALTSHILLRRRSRGSGASLSLGRPAPIRELRSGGGPEAADPSPRPFARPRPFRGFADSRRGRHTVCSGTYPARQPAQGAPGTSEGVTRPAGNNRLEVLQV